MAESTDRLMSKERKIVFYVLRSACLQRISWYWHCCIGSAGVIESKRYTTKRGAAAGARNWAKSTLADKFEVEICYG